MKKYKKAAIIMATLFFGSICAGFFLYEYVAETTLTQIEENQND